MVWFDWSQGSSLSRLSLPMVLVQLSFGWFWFMADVRCLVEPVCVCVWAWKRRGRTTGAGEGSAGRAEKGEHPPEQQSRTARRNRHGARRIVFGSVVWPFLSCVFLKRIRGPRTEPASSSYGHTANAAKGTILAGPHH